jgi:hypothetical protein
LQPRRRSKSTWESTVGLSGRRTDTARHMFLVDSDLFDAFAWQRAGRYAYAVIRKHEVVTAETSDYLYLRFFQEAG